MERSHRIQLGRNHTLCQGDLCRALFCSMAVYKNAVDAEDLLRKAKSQYPSVTFHKVHMSRVPPAGQDAEQKFLVAYTEEDEVYIAFQGTKSLGDKACDLQTDELSRFGGSFHRGFFERADVFLGRTGCKQHNPIPHLLQSKKRIIFCGHSLGGAVAHMVLLRFLLEDDTHLLHMSSDAYRDSMFSIAFGAPHVCDRKAARNINNDVNLAWRFINIVNRSDPVPRLLHHLPSTASAILKAKSEDAAKVTLKHIVGWVGWIMARFAGGGNSSTEQHDGEISDTIRYKYDIIADIHKKSLQNIQELEPDFHPIGQYVFLNKEYRRNTAGGYHWNVHQLHGDDSGMSKFLRNVDFRKEYVQQHKILSYKSALVDAFFNERSALPAAVLPHPEAPYRLVLTTPAPKVKSAELWIADPGHRHIVIKGENLLFLREAVMFNGLQPWTTREQSDTRLVVYDSPSEDLATSSMVGGVSKVIIRTAFGDAQHDVVMENSGLDGPADIGIRIMISNVIQTFMMVEASQPSTPGLTQDHLNCLDNIVSHCVPGLREDQKMSTKLQKYYSSCKKGSDTGKQIDEVNGMARKVVQFLKKSDLFHKVLKLTIGETHFDTEESNDLVARQGQGANADFLDVIKALDTTFLESKVLQKAPLPSVHPIIKVVVDIISLYKTEVDEKYFVGVFGAEDAGKSTFIKKIFEKFDPSWDQSQLPEIGTHTTIVRRYMLNRFLWLVDFPGCDSVGHSADVHWREFTSLCKSVVLFFNFEFDIKREQVQIYKTLKDLDAEVVVVFNKVDEKFTKRYADTFTAEYFTKLRLLAASQLKCSEENVHFACLNPSFEDRFIKLKTLGVWGFEELAQKVLRDVPR